MEAEKYKGEYVEVRTSTSTVYGKVKYAVQEATGFKLFFDWSWKFSKEGDQPWCHYSKFSGEFVRFGEEDRVLLLTETDHNQLVHIKIKNIRREETNIWI